MQDEHVEAWQTVTGLDLGRLVELCAEFQMRTGKTPTKLYLPIGLEIYGLQISFISELKEPVIF